MHSKIIKNHKTNILYIGSSLVIYYIGVIFAFIIFEGYSFLSIQSENLIPLKVVIFPLAAAFVTISCFLIELFFVGYDNSSLKEFKESKSNSMKMDFLFFCSRISGLAIVFAWGISLANLDFFTAIIKNHTTFQLLSPSDNIVTQVILLIFFESIAFYAYHRLMHTRFFWEIHKFHHSAKNFNPLLPYRNHFLDLLFATWIFSIFGVILGGSTHAVLIAAALNAFYQSLAHSKISLKNKWVEYFIITPNAHRLHHSADPSHAGKNFGSLSIWDHLFSTYSRPATNDKYEFGILNEDYINPKSVNLKSFMLINISGIYRWIKSLLIRKIPQ